MASTNKTVNLALNSWVGNDTPQRVDFDADNAIIDLLFDASTGHKHTGAAGDAPKLDSTGLAAGAATDSIIGTRTIDDTLTAATGADTPTRLWSKLANMIKAITGKSSWPTAPRISLEYAADLRGQAFTGAVSTTGTFVANGTGTFGGNVITTASGGGIKNQQSGQIATGIFQSGNNVILGTWDDISARIVLNVSTGALTLPGTSINAGTYGAATKAFSVYDATAGHKLFAVYDSEVVETASSTLNDGEGSIIINRIAQGTRIQPGTYTSIGELYSAGNFMTGHNVRPKSGATGYEYLTSLAGLGGRVLELAPSVGLRYLTNTADPTAGATFSGTVRFQIDDNGNASINGGLTVAGGKLSMTNATSNLIDFGGTAGVAAPDANLATSIGTRIRLFGDGTSGHSAYGIGVESETLWLASYKGYKWYNFGGANGGSPVSAMSLDVSGLLSAGALSMSSESASFIGSPTYGYLRIAYGAAGVYLQALNETKTSSKTLNLTGVNGAATPIKSFYNTFDDGNDGSATIAGKLVVKPSAGTSTSMDVRNNSVSSTDTTGAVSIGLGWLNHLGARIEGKKSSDNTTMLVFYTEHGYSTPLERLRIQADAGDPILIDGTYQMWHAGNFDPSAKANLNGAAFTGVVSSNIGGNALLLKPGSADHVYTEFYARTAAPTTRSGYYGFAIVAANDMTMANEISGGNILLKTAGSGTVKINNNVTYHAGNVTGAATSILTANLTASRALVSDSSGKVAASSATSTELGYLSGVSSNVQDQLGDKLDASRSANILTLITVPGALTTTSSTTGNRTASYTTGGSPITVGLANYKFTYDSSLHAWIYLDACFGATTAGATGYVGLYDLNLSTVVLTMSNTSPVAEMLRSSTLNLIDGHEYCLAMWSGGGGTTCQLVTARILFAP